MSYSSKILLVVGPTTTGKTEIAFRVAQRTGGEVINADRFYLFDGFPTMTGLPDFSLYPGVKSHLYQILDPRQEALSELDFSAKVEITREEITGRGKIPIVEGSYWKFVRQILDSGSPYVCVGIKWTSLADLEKRIRKRIEDVVFSEDKGIKEVRSGLENGLRNTYVMQKGSVILPVVEYLDGKVTLEAAREKAFAAVIDTATKAYRRFLDFPEVTWFENDSNRTEQVIERITGLIKE